MREKALLVTVNLGKAHGWTSKERSDELRELAISAGAKVIREIVVSVKSINPAYFIGSGKAVEIGALCASEGAGVVIFNNDLSGTQQKNIEDIVNTKTIDRTQLILDIFARRARSNEGKLQVELAQLLYMMPRLTGKGVELSRLGGGIGTRGPGEQKLEVDRRRIRSRIDHLRTNLEDLSKRRSMMRSRRDRFSILSVAIIGYTNVGKSTLINVLTDSDVIVADKLFATLDPTIRTFVMPNRQKILFADTVGFLNELPHHLIEAFKATLEEVVEADVLLHMVDASHPKAIAQSEAVYKVLEEIGAKGKNIITVLNKIDKISDPNLLEDLKKNFYDPVSISATTKHGLDKLVDRLAKEMNHLVVTAEFTIPASDARTLNIIHNNGVVKRQEYRGESLYIEAELPIRIKESIDRLLAHS
ncbi:MAG: GTPase HflX [Candidatus Omnitrophica bacterium]|nr:GTPase HflX [Candidatus Omnitrophota bacterium]